MNASNSKLDYTASFIGILSNIVLSIFKIIIGVISGSISIIADGINNLEDFLSIIVNIIGIKVAGKDADDEHPFGHQRAKNITSVIIASLILSTGIVLLFESISGLFEEAIIKYSNLTVIVLICAIVIKIGQMLVYYYTSKKTKSLTLKNLSKDSFFDALITTSVLGGLFLSRFANIHLDGYIGIVIGLIIIVNGVTMIIESSQDLLGVKSSNSNVKDILLFIDKQEHVLGHHDVIVHSYGESKLFLSVHVELDSNIPFINVHDIVDSIEIKVNSLFHVTLVIHPDPVEISNPELRKVSEQIKIIALELSIDCHEIRIVPGENKKVVFEINLPYKNSSLKDNIIKRFKTELSPYEVVINFDNIYF
jgi:cation diffusion facilitator family transporter